MDAKDLFIRDWLGSDKILAGHETTGGHSLAQETVLVDRKAMARR
jgi:hypothetical protein